MAVFALNRRPSLVWTSVAVNVLSQQRSDAGFTSWAFSGDAIANAFG
jgi:hypothetical protein